MMTFTAIGSLLPNCSAQGRGAGPQPDRRAELHFHLLGLEARPAVRQPPAGHLPGLALGHTEDDVAVPRPGVLAVILARQRWVIRMRVVPADQLESGLFCRLFGGAKIVSSDREA